MSNIRRIHPRNPQPAIIAEAGGIVAAGGVVVFPTRHLYGLGADAFNPRAVEKIFSIKQRAADKPILVLIRERSDLVRFTPPIAPMAACLMDYFWPGSLTLVFAARSSVLPQLTAGSSKIGVRLPQHPVAAALVTATGCAAITATSANVSGQPGASTVTALDPVIVKRADLVLEAGTLRPGVGSTVVDVSGGSAQIIREGAIAAARIRAVLKRRSFKLIDKAP